MKLLREEKQLTQNMRGELIGEPVGNYQNYEYGDSNPYIEQLIQFAVELDTLVEYLTRGRENPTLYPHITVPFHERRKELRIKSGIQKELAKRIGSNESGIQKYEYGENRTRLNQLIQLADLFGVPTDDLVG